MCIMENNYFFSSYVVIWQWQLADLQIFKNYGDTD